MNTKFEAISKGLMLVLALGVFIISASAQKKMEMVIGKKGLLHFNSSFRAGDTVLKSGTYQVQHVEEGSDHHIIVLKEVPSGQGFRGGNTIPGKEVARWDAGF